MTGTRQRISVHKNHQCDWSIDWLIFNKKYKENCQDYTVICKFSKFASSRAINVWCVSVYLAQTEKVICCQWHAMIQIINAFNTLAVRSSISLISRSCSCLNCSSCSVVCWSRRSDERSNSGSGSSSRNWDCIWCFTFTTDRRMQSFSS